MSKKRDQKIRDLAAPLLSEGERIELVGRAVLGGPDPWIQVATLQMKHAGKHSFVLTDRRFLLLKERIIAIHTMTGEIDVEVPRDRLQVKPAFTLWPYRTLHLEGPPFGRLRLSLFLGERRKALPLAQALPLVRQGT